MRQLDRNWPPLIVAREKSFWIILRDTVLTTIMWVMFAVMLESEFEFVFSSSIERWGLRHWLARLGFDDVPFEGNAVDFVRALSPYLGLSLILIVSLLSFATDTIRRRRKALRGPPPPRLDPAVEAHHAELSTMASPANHAIDAQPLDLPEEIALDPRRMLALLDRRDETALADVRGLRVTWVHVTPDGHYRILPAGDA